MVTWSNTLVYSCECVCLFVLFYSYSFILWMFFSICLVLSDVYWHVPHSHAINAEPGSVEWMYVYVCKRGRYFVAELCLCHWIFMLEGYVDLFEIMCFCFHSLVIYTSRTHTVICCWQKGIKTSPLMKGCFSWIKWVEFRIMWVMHISD
jgi:hypothetical protein